MVWMNVQEPETELHGIFEMLGNQIGETTSPANLSMLLTQ